MQRVTLDRDTFAKYNETKFEEPFKLPVVENVKVDAFLVVGVVLPVVCTQNKLIRDHMHITKN